MKTHDRSSLLWALLAIGIGGALVGHTLRARSSDPHATAAVEQAQTRRVQPEPRGEPPPLPSSAALAAGTTDRFAAFPGQRFVYRVDARWQTRFARPDPAVRRASRLELRGDVPARLALHVSGDLHVVVLARSGEDYVLRVHLDGVRVRATRDGRRQTRLDAAAMRWPALVRFSEDGRLLGFAFEPGAPAKARRFLISLFALSHQFVPRADDAPWSVSGLRDENGPFRARFAWRDPELLARGHAPVLHRQVVAYEGGALAAPAGDVGVARSDGEARLSEGWIDHVAAREERRGSMADVLDIVSEARLRVQRTSIDTVTIDPSALPEDGIVWEVSIADTDLDEPIDDVDVPAGPALELLARRLTALREAVAVQDGDGDDVLNHWNEIAALITRSPHEVLPALLHQLRAGELTGESAGWVLAAIGAAGAEGRPEAVAAIADLVRDPAADDEVKLAALVASQQLGEYGAPLLDAAVDVLLTSDALPEDSPLPAAAALLLGQLAGLESLSAENREIALASLDAVRDWAFHDAQAAVYFEALGNSRDQALIATALEYLEHPDEAVRRASSEVLRQLEQDPRALDGLLGKLASADHPSVRLAAIDSLANMPPTPETTSALAALAVSDADEAIRAGAVTALGSLAGTGAEGVWPTIERAAADANPDVRQIAADLLDNRANGAVE